ncbi:ABC-2 family transporter protein [mine drainage metagenome]|uniref:ABC-2 family transporter protein n=1 Tax=mine drainage metagenome TaxID=410659 RepID=A0A1J5QNX0_9ZZZZ
MAKHNLRIVVGFEVHRTLAKKRFWVLTLLVPMAIGLVFGLVFVSNSSTNNSLNSQKSAKFTFAYTDASGEVSDAVVSSFGGTKSTNPTQSIADVKAGRLDAFFDYPANPATEQITAYGVNRGIFENEKYRSVATQILSLSAQQKIGSPELALLAQGKVKVATTTYSNGRESGGLNGVVPPMLFLLVFYVVIILLGNQMLSSTLEEKENRVTEMILTTVNATTLIIGKIISLFTVGIVQMVVFVIPMIIGYVFFHSSLNLPNFDLSKLVFDPTRMTIGALLLLGGFTLFTGTLVAIGAIMPTAKEAGVFFGAMMTLIFIPFYVISLVVSDPHAFIVQAFTYFPFSAPITAMLRNAFGSLTLWEAAIVIGELFILGFLMLRLAVRLFRYGSIEYTKKVSIRSVLASH